MIKAVIFDFGSVLVGDEWRVIYREIARRLKIPEEKVQEINYVFIRDPESLAAYFQNPFRDNAKIFPATNPILDKRPN